MSNRMTLSYDFGESTLFNVKEVNKSFASGSLKVMYTGKNRNGSDISRDAVTRALPTLNNVPIVCHWDSEAKEIGGHDKELVNEGGGKYRIRNLTEPCGVIPDHAETRFEVIADENGVEHEYLVIDGVLLWKRQDVYDYIANDLGGKVKHSMEIDVTNREKKKDGTIEIIDFEFTALCLLGNCEPCFEGSELELFSDVSFEEFKAQWKDQFAQMMSELKETYSLITPQPEVDDNSNSKNFTEGGKVLDEKMKVVADYGYTVEELDFSIEEMTVEELTEKFEAMKAQSSAETEKAEEEPAQHEAFELSNEARERIRCELRKEKVMRPWGEEPRYCLIDFDPEQHMVYAEDTAECWILVGFSYSMNNDDVVIDFKSRKRMKWQIVEYVDGDEINPVADIMSNFDEKYNEKDAEWSAKYQTASDTIESMNTELEELRKFKTETEDAAEEVARGEVLAQFEDLSGVEAFEALKSNHEGVSPADLEEKCYAIRGRQAVPATFAAKNDTHKLAVDRSDCDADDGYGGLFAKYGHKK